MRAWAIRAWTHRYDVTSFSAVQTGDSHVDWTMHGATLAQNLQALGSTVAAACDNDASVYIHAGDGFANGRPSMEAVLGFYETLLPLADAGIPVVLLGGNHDRIKVAASDRSPTTLVAEMLSKAGGEVHLIESQPQLVTTSTGMQVVGLPWLSKASLMLNDGDVTGLSAAESNRRVVSYALDKIGHLVSRAASGSPLLFTAHATVEAVRLDTAEGLARRGSELDMVHVFDEPVLPLGRLAAFGFDFGGLSHIHDRMKLGHGFYYAGSTNRFTVIDADKKKAASLVEFDDTGAMTRIRGVETAARPMARLDLSGGPDVDALLDALPEKALVDVVLPEGDTALDKRVTEKLEERGAKVVKVRRIVAEVAPTAQMTTALPEGASAREALAAYLEARHTPDADAVMAVAAELLNEEVA